MDLSHFDTVGNAVMVDISAKDDSFREAVAVGRIRINEAGFAMVTSGSATKGDVLGVARIAGIMAVKRTDELIPLCHSLNLTHASVDFRFLEASHEIECLCTVRCLGKTGAEMEALCGVSMALATIYDMCKSIDKTMEIRSIRLLKKEGGKSGSFNATENEERDLEHTPC